MRDEYGPRRRGQALVNPYATDAGVRDLPGITAGVVLAGAAGLAVIGAGPAFADVDPDEQGTGPDPGSSSSSRPDDGGAGPGAYGVSGSGAQPEPAADAEQEHRPSSEREWDPTDPPDGDPTGSPDDTDPDEEAPAATSAGAAQARSMRVDGTEAGDREETEPAGDDGAERDLTADPDPDPDPEPDPRSATVVSSAGGAGPIDPVPDFLLQLGVPSGSGAQQGGRAGDGRGSGGGGPTDGEEDGGDPGPPYVYQYDGARTDFVRVLPGEEPGDRPTVYVGRDPQTDLPVYAFSTTPNFDGEQIGMNTGSIHSAIGSTPDEVTLRRGGHLRPDMDSPSDDSRFAVPVRVGDATQPMTVGIEVPFTEIQSEVGPEWLARPSGGGSFLNCSVPGCDFAFAGDGSLAVARRSPDGTVQRELRTTTTPPDLSQARPTNGRWTFDEAAGTFTYYADGASGGASPSATHVGILRDPAGAVDRVEVEGGAGAHPGSGPRGRHGVPGTTYRTVASPTQPYDNSSAGTLDGVPFDFGAVAPISFEEWWQSITPDTLLGSDDPGPEPTVGGVIDGEPVEGMTPEQVAERLGSAGLPPTVDPANVVFPPDGPATASPLFFDEPVTIMPDNSIRVVSENGTVYLYPATVSPADGEMASGPVEGTPLVGRMTEDGTVRWEPAGTAPTIGLRHPGSPGPSPDGGALSGGGDGDGPSGGGVDGVPLPTGPADPAPGPGLEDPPGGPVGPDRPSGAGPGSAGDGGAPAGSVPAFLRRLGVRSAQEGPPDGRADGGQGGGGGGGTDGAAAGPRGPYVYQLGESQGRPDFALVTPGAELRDVPTVYVGRHPGTDLPIYAFSTGPDFTDEQIGVNTAEIGSYLGSAPATVIHREGGWWRADMDSPSVDERFLVPVSVGGETVPVGVGIEIPYSENPTEIGPERLGRPVGGGSFLNCSFPDCTFSFGDDGSLAVERRGPDGVHREWRPTAALPDLSQPRPGFGRWEFDEGTGSVAYRENGLSSRASGSTTHVTVLRTARGAVDRVQVEGGVADAEDVGGDDLFDPDTDRLVPGTSYRMVTSPGDPFDNFAEGNVNGVDFVFGPTETIQPAQLTDPHTVEPNPPFGGVIGGDDVEGLSPEELTGRIEDSGLPVTVDPGNVVFDPKYPDIAVLSGLFDRRNVTILPDNSLRVIGDDGTAYFLPATGPIGDTPVVRVTRADGTVEDRPTTTAPTIRFRRPGSPGTSAGGGTPPPGGGTGPGPSPTAPPGPGGDGPPGDGVADAAGLQVENTWSPAGEPDVPTVVLDSSHRFDQIPRNPVQAGVLDHLDGDGAEALRALRGSEYLIGDDADWSRAVASVAGQLRQLSLDVPPMSPERARRLFPVSGTAAPVDDQLSPLAQRIVQGANPSGLTSPEMGCWLVCDAQGRARVLDDVLVGDVSSIDLRWPAVPESMIDALRWEHVHTHPFTRGEAAGLSAADRSVAVSALRDVRDLPSAAEFGMTAIDLLTGTVTRAVPSLERPGTWDRVQVMQGGAGPVTDRLNVAGRGVRTAGPGVERPLPLDVVRDGVSAEMERQAASARRTPWSERGDDFRRAVERDLWDARLALAGSIPRVRRSGPVSGAADRPVLEPTADAQGGSSVPTRAEPGTGGVVVVPEPGLSPEEQRDLGLVPGSGVDDAEPFELPSSTAGDGGDVGGFGPNDAGRFPDVPVVTEPESFPSGDEPEPQVFTFPLPDDDGDGAVPGAAGVAGAGAGALSLSAEDARGTASPLTPQEVEFQRKAAIGGAALLAGALAVTPIPG